MENPTCPRCGEKQQPWALRSWRCPACGIATDGQDVTAQRLEALEKRIAALEAVATEAAP